jgi:hypothetical protein
MVPFRGSITGKAFRTGKTQHFDHVEELHDDQALRI